MSRSKKKYQRMRQILDKTGKYTPHNQVARNRLYKLVASDIQEAK